MGVQGPEVMAELILGTLEFCAGPVPETLEEAARAETVVSYPVPQRFFITMGVCAEHVPVTVDREILMRNRAVSSGDVTFFRLRHVRRDQGVEGVVAAGTVTRRGEGGQLQMENTNVAEGQEISLLLYT